MKLIIQGKETPPTRTMYTADNRTFLQIVDDRAGLVNGHIIYKVHCNLAVDITKDGTGGYWEDCLDFPSWTVEVLPPDTTLRITK